MKSSRQNKTVLIVAIIALLLLGGFLLLKPRGAGQAISIGGQPYLNNVIDLAQEERVSFTFDFEGENAILFTAKTGVFDPVVQDYQLQLVEIDGRLVSVRLFRKDNSGEYNGFVAEDFLAIGEGLDSTRFYLDDDATPDIGVVYANGAVTLSNLHYLAPTGARIEVQYLNGTTIPLIQRLDTGRSVQLRIKATSIVPPTVSLSFTGVQNYTFYNVSSETNPQGTNYTIAYINYTAPAQSAAVVMDVNAAVLGKNNHVYYMFAVGNLLYALNKPNNPSLILLYDEQRRPVLNTTFLPTAALQPFAVPCESIANNAFFTGGNIRKIYGYDTANEEPLVALPGLRGADPVGDFNGFELWKCYFIELINPLATNLAIPCTPISVVPPSGVPLLAGVERLTLPRGWNLISLPGTIPRPLTDFTSDTNFKLIECSQGYSCVEIARDSIIYPGQPYWVHTDQALDIHYIIQR